MRLGILAVVVLLAFSVLGFRLWFLQMISGDQYTVMADNNRLRTVSIEAPRGVIYDRGGPGVGGALDPRNGEVLAMASYPDYPLSLWVGGMGDQEYATLIAEDANNPLFDRALKGLYPAASTFT